ncbi:MAG: acylphosphatase [Chitinophagaceae bacterium]|nr:MAG: acylphosphatase [Chitinophagaceae bacterium]
MRTVKIQVTGKVQGVFYRATARGIADGLQLAGWIRNRADGAVEALVQGPEEQVAAFIEWCHQGPDAAEVEEVAVQELPTDPSLTSFEVWRGKTG